MKSDVHSSNMKPSTHFFLPLVVLPSFVCRFLAPWTWTKWRSDPLPLRRSRPNSSKSSCSNGRREPPTGQSLILRIAQLYSPFSSMHLVIVDNLSNMNSICILCICMHFCHFILLPRWNLGRGSLSLQNLVAVSQRFYWPVLISKQFPKGTMAKIWLLSPVTSSQSEGYSSKWLIWLMCREPLLGITVTLQEPPP